MEIPRNLQHERILKQVRRIPAGRVATYGQIAALAGLPRHARQVGRILRSMDSAGTESDVPWHRVVNAAGRISVRGQGAVAQLQQAMLEAEGIEFDLQRPQLDLQRYRWKAGTDRNSR